jgi:hypothetical protein
VVWGGPLLSGPHCPHLYSGDNTASTAQDLLPWFPSKALLLHPPSTLCSPFCEVGVRQEASTKSPEQGEGKGPRHSNRHTQTMTEPRVCREGVYTPSLGTWPGQKSQRGTEDPPQTRALGGDTESQVVQSTPTTGGEGGRIGL